MKIAFICVNHNSFFETQKYIVSVKELEKQENVKIIIVDNSKDDYDFNILKEYIKNEVDIILLKTINNGYFNALNVGLDYIFSESKLYSFVIVGNNDLTFQKDFIHQLEEIKLNKDELVICPDVLNNQGSHENPHVLKKKSFFEILKYQIYFSSYTVSKVLNFFHKPFIKPYDCERKLIFMGIGAIYILTPNFFKHFAQLWDEVFLYGEEAVFGGQIRSVNGQIIYEPKLKCFHNESSSTNSFGSKERFTIVKNSFRVYKKYL